MSVNILSVDGGGVRCYMSAKILANLEQYLSRPLREVFTYFSGVSAGSILVMGLLKGYSASEVVKMFRDFAPKVFYAPLSYKVASGGGLFNSIYPDNYIETELFNIFGEWMGNEVSKDFLITAYDINRDMPLYFSRDTYIPVADIIRASTAAPVYFPPKELTISGQRVVAVDGGVISNNPCEIALVHALNKYGNSNINMLSVGSGMNQRSTPIEKVPRGLISWSTNILDTIFNANTLNSAIDVQLIEQRLLSRIRGVEKFDRIEWNLGQDIRLDDAQTFDTMDRIIDGWLGQNQQMIKDIAMYYNTKL